MTGWIERFTDSLPTINKFLISAVILMMLYVLVRVIYVYVPYWTAKQKYEYEIALLEKKKREGDKNG